MTKFYHLSQKSMLQAAFMAFAILIVAMPLTSVAQGTFNLETESGTGTGWTWAYPVLTINDGADVTITGQVNQSDNHKRIEVAAGATAHITFNNLAITTGEYVSGDYETPLYLHNGVTLTLTLEGENTLLAGSYVPAISATTGRTLIIDGTGSLTAEAGWSCAAIGGGLWDNGPCGTITINGGIINAKGAASSWIGTAGAGIGGGAAEPSGNITINGGVVTAVSVNDSGMGIGNGGGDDIGTLTISGNAMVFTNIAGDMNPANKTGGILVVRNATFWYAGNNFTLDHNVTVPSTNLFTVEEGKTFTIPAGKTLINNGAIVNYSNITINGTLINNGTIYNVNAGTINGTVSGTAPTTIVPQDNQIDISTGSSPMVGEKWVFANNVFTVLDGADVVVTGTGSRRVEVAANSESNITINNLSIPSLGNNLTPFLINQGANVNLTIEGDNNLKAGRSKAALQAAEGASVVIGGSGSLSATGGTYGGAAIGGAFRENCGKITINSGTITANAVESGSYYGGAGIGGGGAGIVFFSFAGIGGKGGDITINGGVVTANGETGAAGIGGGGEAHDGGSLTMNADGVAFVSALSNNLGIQPNKTNLTSGILFDGFPGVFYGTYVTITDDLTVPEYYSLTIPTDATLKIPYEKTLENQGTITNNGTIINCGTIIGEIGNNQPEECEPLPVFYTVTIFMHPEDEAGKVTGEGEYEENDEVTVTATANEGYLFLQWTKNGELISSETEYKFTITEDVTLVAHFAIEEGINEHPLNSVVLFPNPFTKEIFFSNPELISNIQITDILGKILSNISLKEQSIQTENLTCGVYFVIIEGINGDRIVRKMVKK